MNLLKKKNGLALVAVIVLLMILTLFVPAMLTYADTATSSAVKGTTRQKAAYLARTGVEMAVSTFIKTFDDGDVNVETAYEALYRRLGGNLKTGETALSELNTETVYLFIDNEVPVPTVGPNGETEVFSEDYYNSVYTTDYDAYINNARYKYGGKVDVKITRRDEVHVYKVMSDGYSYDICCNPDYSADFAAACNSNVNNPIVASGTDSYAYVRQKYAQYNFTGTAEVNGVKVTKKASALDTINTKDSGWLNDATSNVTVVNGETVYNRRGFDMIAVNPDNASSKQKITYYDKAVGNNTQDVLIYSTYGNVIIDSNVKYLSKAQLNAAGINDLSDAAYAAMVESMPLYLGCEPAMSYRDDKTQGSLSNHVDCITYTSGAQNTFVSFTATNAIQVNLPVNVTINPCIQTSFEISFGDHQQSIYKMMLFQANEIVFKEKVTNFMSFAKPADWDINDVAGKRYGSIVLAATESTPYSYYNESRGKTVKAGKVTFLDDVYLVYINYGGDYGSPKYMSREAFLNWNKKIYYSGDAFNSGEKSQYNKVGGNVSFSFPTITQMYKGHAAADPIAHEKIEYKLTKLFNEGDVYYFNAEIEIEKNGVKQKAGLNLAAWWVETYFFNHMVAEAKTLYQKGVYWAFLLVNSNQAYTYKADDMHYVGNVNESLPTPADLSTVCYVVWDS